MFKKRYSAFRAQNYNIFFIYASVRAYFCHFVGKKVHGTHFVLVYIKKK